MSGSTPTGHRRWLLVAAVLGLLAAGCGTGTIEDDPLANARIASPADEAPSSTDGGGDPTSQSSVRIELPPAADTDGGPSQAPTTPTDGSSSAVTSSTGESSTRLPSSTGETFTPTIPATSPPSDTGRASAYSIVAQATVPAMVARSSPDAEASTVANFTNPTGSGAPLVFQAVDGGGTTADWIEVHLPIQPNGSTGWVRRQEVELTNNPYRLEVDRASYSLRVFYRNDLWLESTVAIGTGATPTPVGDFYLLELLRPLQENGPYGPFAFGLSGFSEVLETFGGADAAIIGIHGTNDPSSIGSNVSHGCIRLENAVIEQLASTLPLGTPVRIT